MLRGMMVSVGLAGFVIGLSPTGAFAQRSESASGECTIAPAPNGVIRGDRVPSGCVITAERTPREPREESVGLVVVGGTVVLVPVLVLPRLFLPDPPFIGVPPGPGAAEGAEEGLPRVRSEPFGPIFQPFGPVLQPFRPTVRDFDRVPATPAGARPQRRSAQAP